VSRFALHLWQIAPENTVVRPADINGEPGFITYVDGTPFNILSFEVDEDRIVAIRAVVNPDKLTTVRPLE